MVREVQHMATTSLQSLGYLPVATASLRPESVLECDLYIQRPGRPYAELYRGSTYPLEVADVERLAADGVDHLYIRLEEVEAYRDYLCKHLLHDKTVPLAARVQALREVTRVAFQDALTANDTDQIVNVASPFGGSLATMVAEQSLPFRELFATLEHDYNTFTHVCNVSVYGTMLAIQLGTCTDAVTLGELATGGLLHDIGKRHIPLHVLNKPGKLNDEEWELIRQHPTSGYRELATRADLTWGQLMMVYQHHERLDGSGYPSGISAAEIHPWARICCVVDVFDAMTSHRPYRRPMPTAQACDFLNKYAGVWFDAEAVACWTSHVRSTTTTAS
jgi:HD-GYP domain-containing protein (c-di-GMP phosphodiesterase class II)